MWKRTSFNRADRSRSTSTGCSPVAHAAVASKRIHRSIHCRTYELLSGRLGKSNCIRETLVRMHSQILATGLSALYSDLPHRLATQSDEWFVLTKKEWSESAALVQFMNSLQFCNDVIQVDRFPPPIGTRATFRLRRSLIPPLAIIYCSTSTMDFSFLFSVRVSIK